MPEARPALSVVGPEEEPSGDRGARRLGRSFWLVVLLLLLAAAGLVLQSRQVRQMEGAVARLEADLFATQAARVAAEARLSRVRGQMGGVREALTGLQDELSQLDALMDPEPPGLPAPSASP